MKAAVLGSPISHSLSPVLHRAAYRALGLDHTYDAIEVGIEDFPSFFRNLDSDWLGLSLTMPLKEIAFSVADVVTETASLTTSINTLVFSTQDGTAQINGDNTDVYGIGASITEVTTDAMRTACVLGSGATARSALVAIAALGIESVDLIARNPGSIEVCAELAAQLGITFRHLTAPDPELNRVDVVINTTPQGIADQWTSSVEAPQGILLDAVYKPHPTNIVSAWLTQGGVACPGYNMLLHQAVRQVELMTGQPGPLEAMRLALHDALRTQGTIV